MGRFMKYNGQVGPSTSYLKAHILNNYKPGDSENPEYDLEEDEEALTMIRHCDKCGEPFTLVKAIETFVDQTPYGPNYVDKFVGDLCGSCAAFEIQGLMDQT